VRNRSCSPRSSRCALRSPRCGGPPVGSQAELSATPSTRVELATPGLGNPPSVGVEYVLPG
jgi:hypothetical protein